MGNLIYVKNCLGKDGKPIKIYKIRTMELDAEHRLDELVHGFDGFGHPIIDPRVTPIGRFLRRYWVDEVPQLYNLLTGDIKLVGIRPNTEHDWQKYPKEIMERALRQQPGLMGVQYAYPPTGDFDIHLMHLTEYMDRWEKDPVQTDRDYFFRIARNIMFNNVRSS